MTRTALCATCEGIGLVAAGPAPDQARRCSRCHGDGFARTRTYRCCGGYGEHFDGCPLVASVCDRWGDRYVSPAGDRRERTVPCDVCREPTGALDRVCDLCMLAHTAETVA